MFKELFRKDLNFIESYKDNLISTAYSLPAKGKPATDAVLRVHYFRNLVLLKK